MDIHLKQWVHRFPSLQGLQRKLETGDIPHAMLFLGTPISTSEFTKDLARQLLCECVDPLSQDCESCKLFTAGTHPDFMQIDGSISSSGRIKTSEIEFLQEWLAVRPHRGKYKVYVILGIDTATAVSANRLLKTLEEPSSTTIALLTANFRQAVLPTIQSRCFMYSLDMEGDYLWEDAEVSNLLRRLENQERDAFAAFFTAMVQWTEDWLFGAEPALLLADEWMKLSGEIGLTESLRIMSTWYRDLIHHSAGENIHLRFSTDICPINKVEKISRKLNISQWAQVIELILQTLKRSQAHVVPLLNIEQLCIRLRGVLNRV